MPGMDHLELFGTPIAVHRLDGVEGLTRALRAHLLEESARVPGITRSNLGGWHSIPDLALRTAEPFPSLLNLLVDALSETLREWARVRGRPAGSCRFQIQAWAMVLGHGDWVAPHDHAEAHLSGVYYVDAGDARDERSGTLALLDPRGGAAVIPGLDLFPSTFQVRPESGMLVVFPGLLKHYVHPYLGDRPRIVVSFNARVQPG